MSINPIVLYFICIEFSNDREINLIFLFSQICTNIFKILRAEGEILNNK